MKYRYAVTLTAHGNIDHGQDPYTMIAEPGEGYGETIEDLQFLVQKYISDNALGGGNWTGGEVTDLDTDTIIGHISYNGRYWPKEAGGDDL